MKSTIGSLIASVLLNWIFAIFIVTILLYFEKYEWVHYLDSNIEIIFTAVVTIFWYLLTVEDVVY